MKLVIANKIFNFNHGGFERFSPHLLCYNDFNATNIYSHFYFTTNLSNRWFYSHKTYLSENNNVVNIDEFYKSLKSQLNVYCFSEEKEKEEIIDSIIDKKIRILL